MSRSFQNKFVAGTPGTPKIVTLSQAAYDAITIKDPNTIYVIV